MKKTKDPFKTGTIEMEEAKRKKEMAMIEKEDARKQMEATKKEYINEKSRTALERLQIAWVKANITCTALGFTAYKFFVARVEAGKHPIGHIITGREMGIFLISVGSIMLVLATIQHKKNIAKLKIQYENMRSSVSLLLSYFILGFSIVLLLLVILEA